LIPQQGDIVEPQDAITTLFEPPGTNGVIRPRRCGAVLRTIKFDDEARSRTIEIHDVRADWVLAAEPQVAHLLSPETGPQLPFGFSRVGAQLPRGLSLQLRPAFEAAP
jgi:hypothetical protein